MMKRRIVFAAVGLVTAGLLSGNAFAQKAKAKASPLDSMQPVQERSIKIDKSRLKLICEDDFSKPVKIARGEDLIKAPGDGPASTVNSRDAARDFKRIARPPKDAEWIAEGWGDARIIDGRLHVAPSKMDDKGVPAKVDDDHRSHMVIWNRRAFPADILVEFTVNHCGSDDGLTLFFFASEGNNGEDVFDLKLPARRAIYRIYNRDALRNYTVSYWSRNKTDQPGSKGYNERFTARLRRNPGMDLIATGHSETNESGTKDYKVRLLKVGQHIEFEVDGKVIVEWDDPNPLGAGHIGLRCMSGVKKVTYDDFRVWAVDAKK